MVVKQYFGYRKIGYGEGNLVIPIDGNGKIIRNIRKTVYDKTSFESDVIVRKTVESANVHVIVVLLDDRENDLFYEGIKVKQLKIE